MRCTPSCGGLLLTLYSVARRNRVIAVVSRLKTLVMDHPLSTPSMAVDAHATSDTRQLVDTLIFAINFATAILLFVACFISVFAADSPFSFIGGLFTALPVAGYALAEWLCWYRRRRWLYRPMGTLNLLLSLFFVFGLVSNVGESVKNEGSADPIFIVVVGLGFGLIATYLGFCGWRRLHFGVERDSTIAEI